MVESKIVELLSPILDREIHIGGLHKGLREGIACYTLNREIGFNTMGQSLVNFACIFPSYAQAKQAAEDVEQAILSVQGATSNHIGSFDSVTMSYYGQLESSHHLFTVSAYFAM